MNEYIYEITTGSDGVDCYFKRGEIVRCKDCKHYKTDHPKANGYHCCWRNHNIFPMKEDDFCSYGERMKLTQKEKTDRYDSLQTAIKWTIKEYRKQAKQYESSIVESMNPVNILEYGRGKQLRDCIADMEKWV